MKKLTLLLAALALAATSSVADAKKAKKRAPAAKPVAAQEMPGQPATRVIGGFFGEVSKIGQPRPAPKGKKKAG